MSGRFARRLDERVALLSVRLGDTENVGRTPESTAGAVLSLVLGALIPAATVLGPLVTDRVRFHMSSDALVQYVGGEAVTAMVAVVLIVSAAAWWVGTSVAVDRCGGCGPTGDLGPKACRSG